MGQEVVDLSGTFMEFLLANGELDREEAQVWIEPLVVAEDGQGGFVITCPNNFHRNWTRDKHLGLLAEALGVTIEQVALKVAESQKAPLPEIQKPVGELTFPLASSQSRLERAIIWEGNRFALSCCRELVKGNASMRAFLLVSGNGLGKTYLVVAMGAAFQAKGKKVALVTADEFMNVMIRSIRAKEVEKFLARYNTVDVFILEGLKHLEDKRKTQEFLGQITGSVLKRGGNVIVTSTELQYEVKLFDGQLRSLLESALVAQITPPDFEASKVILKQLAEDEGIAGIDQEAIELLAEHFSGRHINSLKGALVNLAVRASLNQKPMDVALCREVLEINGFAAPTVGIDKIIEAVCGAYGVTREKLCGKVRGKKLSWPRHLVAYLASKHTSLSVGEISRILQKDHSSINYGVHSVEASGKMAEVEELERRLGLKTD